MNNIVLIGFMGVGKSSVGRRLAYELGFKFVDTDGLIEKEAGMSVKDIFEKFGEDRFRELESAVIERLVSGALGDGLVVSAGGGSVVNPSNREVLKRWATVICLEASVTEILRRVGDRMDRPLLNADDKRGAVEALLREREAAYKECDLRVDTTSMDAAAVAEVIKVFLEDRARGHGQ